MNTAQKPCLFAGNFHDGTIENVFNIRGMGHIFLSHLYPVRQLIPEKNLLNRNPKPFWGLENLCEAAMVIWLADTTHVRNMLDTGDHHPVSMD